MISASPATVFSLCADTALVIFTAALVLLALWNDWRRRSNQFFALSMALWGLYGAINVPLHLEGALEINYRVFFAAGAMVYAFAFVATANFLLSFAGAPYAHWWRVRLAGVVFAAWFLVLVLRDAVFTEITPLPHGDYHYAISPLGRVGMLVGVAYLAGVGLALYRSRVPRAKESALAVLGILLGLVFLTVAAPLGLHRYSPNVLALIVAVIMLGHVVLKYQVFLPLERLNAELERKNAELEMASQAKARFLANMSHDLRTPLNSILGYARVFLAGAYGEPTEAQSERLQRILRNGQHLLEMINDVLDFTRLDARQLELYRTRVETDALLEALADEFEPAAYAKGLVLVRGYGALPAIHADEERVRQMLRNLLSNALRHTTHGALIMRGYYDPLQERVVLSVTDTGEGISPESQKRLFEPLVPTVLEPTEQPDGIGLGLYITKKLVEMHGGRIWYESTVGQGSTFYLALPTQEIPPHGKTLRQARRRSGERMILVVATEAEHATALQRALEAAGFHAYGMTCAHMALQMAHETRPALVILSEVSLCMPVARALLTLYHDPATAQTPVLLLTQEALPLFPTLPNVRDWVPQDASSAVVLKKVRALLVETGTVEAAR